MKGILSHICSLYNDSLLIVLRFLTNKRLQQDSGIKGLLFLPWVSFIFSQLSILSQAVPEGDGKEFPYSRLGTTQVYSQSWEAEA